MEVNGLKKAIHWWQFAGELRNREKNTYKAAQAWNCQSQSRQQSGLSRCKIMKLNGIEKRTECFPVTTNWLNDTCGCSKGNQDVLTTH